MRSSRNLWALSSIAATSDERYTPGDVRNDAYLVFIHVTPYYTIFSSETNAVISLDTLTEATLSHQCELFITDVMPSSSLEMIRQKIISLQLLKLNSHMNRCERKDKNVSFLSPWELWLEIVATQHLFLIPKPQAVFLSQINRWVRCPGRILQNEPHRTRTLPSCKNVQCTRGRRQWR